MNDIEKKPVRQKCQAPSPGLRERVLAEAARVARQAAPVAEVARWSTRRLRLAWAAAFLLLIVGEIANEKYIEARLTSSRIPRATDGYYEQMLSEVSELGPGGEYLARRVLLMAQFDETIRHDLYDISDEWRLRRERMFGSSAEFVGEIEWRAEARLVEIP